MALSSDKVDFVERGNRKCIAFILITILILPVYLNTVNNEWHFDDRPNIIEADNVHIKNLSYNELKQSIRKEKNNKIYRPLPRISFALNWYFGGKDTTGYHFVNIAIHIITCFFLYLTILLICKTPFLSEFWSKNAQFIALLSAVLWATNPIQTQAVTYIVQRMASMAACFYIIGMYFYLKARFQNKNQLRLFWYLATLFFFLLSIGSKENAVMFPVSILLLEICFFHEFLSEKKIKIIIISVITIIFFLLVGTLFFWLFKENPNTYIQNLTEKYSDRPFSLEQRILTQPRILLYYISLIFYPVPTRLSISHDIHLSTSLFTPLTTFISILSIIFIIFLSLKYLNRYRVLSFSVLFFFLNHVVESSIFPLEMIFEHRNYLPSFFLFVPVAAVLCYGISYYQQKKMNLLSVSIIFFSASLIFLFGTGSYVRNIAWDTNKSLWTDAITKSPGQSRPYNNLASALIKEDIQNIKQAEDLIMEAQRNVGQRTGRKERVGYGNLGLLYYKNKNYQLAAKYFTKLLNSQPDYLKARLTLIYTYLNLGELNKAFRHANVTVKNKPENELALELKSFILLKMDQPDKGYKVSKKLYLKNPDNKRALINMGCSLMMLGNYKKARRYLTRAKGSKEYRLSVYMLLLQNELMAENINLAKKYAEDILKTTPINKLQQYFLKAEERGNMNWPTDTQILAPFLEKTFSRQKLIQ